MAETPKPKPIFISSTTPKEEMEKAIFAQISANIFKQLSANDRASVASWMQSNYAKKSTLFPVPTTVKELKPKQERSYYGAGRGGRLEASLEKARRIITKSKPEDEEIGNKLKGLRLLLDVSKLMQEMAKRTKGGNSKMSRGELLAFQERLNAMITGSGVSQDYMNLARMLGAPGGLKDPLAAGRNRRLY